jgi:gp16 family phage-associated protein
MTTNKHISNHIKHQLLKQHRLTMKDFAKRYDFNYFAVSDVVRGNNRGNYGNGKDIKDKLIELIGPLPTDDQQAA